MILEGVKQALLGLDETLPFLVSQTIKSACNVGYPGSIPGSEGSPGERNGNPLQYSSLENSVNRGYSPWGSKESDMTE